MSDWASWAAKQFFESQNSLYKGLTEEIYVTKSNIKVGDRVEAPRHGRGTVLAIVGEDAWVRTEAKDYPLTFDIKKLKLVPKPRTGALCTRNSQPDWWGSQPDWWGSQPRVPGTVLWEVDAVELTPEVRERLKDLL